MDKELEEQLKLLKNNSIEESVFEEHQYIVNCLRLGLTISDLEKLDYIDVLKFFFCSIPKEEKYKKATAEDWDKLM